MSDHDDDALRGVIEEMVLALAPLVEAAQAPDDLMGLLAELGWTAASVPPPLLDLTTAGASLLDALGSEPGELSTAQVLASIGSLVGAIDAIRTRPDSEFPDGLDVAAFKQTIGRDLLDYCIVEYLLRHRFKVGRLLKLMGIIQLTEQPASGPRQLYVQRRVDWARVGTLLSDPMTGFREAYAWNSATPQLPRLLGDVASVLEAFGLQLSFFRLTAEQLAFANAGATEPLAGQLGISLDMDEALGIPPDSTAGVQFLVRAPTAERGPAVAVLPFVNLSGASGEPDDDLPSLAIRGDADLTQGFAVTMAPGRQPVVDAGFLGGQPTATAPVRIEAALRVPPTPGQLERILVGTPDGSRVALHTVTVSAGTAVVSAQQLDAFVELGLEKLRVVVKPAAGEVDSFVATVLGNDGISAELSFGLRLSTLTGFHLTGSGGLDASFPVSVQLGPVDIQAITIGLKPRAQDVDLDVGATVSGGIGPIAIVIDRVGFQLSIRFLDPPVGNLGPLDVAFGFLPPTRLGLAVDAAAITGGGFIGRDPATGRYLGVLDLRAGQIGITALALVDTRLPAGQGDYALLLVLQATFPALQIGFGFALTGVGGLLALNRRLDVDALRSRLAAGTAGRILAPQDPIRNAPALLADLDAIFDPAPGITVVGPTLQLLWAGLVHLDVGVFIELPGPARVVLLGSAHAELERDGRALLSVRVDIVGVVDLCAETAAFDAVLIDSHLLGMLDLTGGAAFRLSWGAQPYAVLTLGGFHPAYHPEPLAFPSTLTRIAMVHGTPKDQLYLRFEGYFAVTSNTLQFGAAVEALIQSGGFRVHGNLGFDALIQRTPFHFQIDIRASVRVAYKDHTLTGLTLTGSLTGPGPTVLRAKVCIELLFFDICFSGTFPLGPVLELLTAPADLLAALVGELGNLARLRASGAPDPHVRLRPPDPALTTPLVAPTGTLVWEQQRAPLDLLVTRVGGTPLPAPAQVSATSTASSTATNDWFAPGQFLDLSDDQALTRPAFELLAGGLRLVGTGVVDGPSAQRTLTTRQLRLPAKATSPPKGVRMFPAWIVAPPARPATPMVAVATERWIVTSPAGERRDLTGAQARQLATLTTAARAVPATDRLAALTF
jgi:hypothetical protein